MFVPDTTNIRVLARYTYIAGRYIHWVGILRRRNRSIMEKRAKRAVRAWMRGCQNIVSCNRAQRLILFRIYYEYYIFFTILPLSCMLRWRQKMVGFGVPSASHVRVTESPTRTNILFSTELLWANVGDWTTCTDITWTRRERKNSGVL